MEIAAALPLDRSMERRPVKFDELRLEMVAVRPQKSSLNQRQYAMMK
jgi:hypothetical protein